MKVSNTSELLEILTFYVSTIYIYKNISNTNHALLGQCPFWGLIFHSIFRYYIFMNRHDSFLVVGCRYCK